MDGLRDDKVFAKAAKLVGLTGKMTATVAGAELIKRLNELILSLGSYPHSKLNLAMRPTKKQATRMIKMECPSCGYIARASQKHLDAQGPALCPCSLEPMVVG